MQTPQERRLAILIDADNAPRKSIKYIMEEVAKYGTPTVKRIYGDWTTPNLAGWKTVLLENALTPIQQYGYTTGKNSTDSAMIIDAMDILYSGRLDGFCLVSSDSDFTRLAIRLREAGMVVYGLGEKKTPNPFIAACDKFIYIEIITPQPVKQPQPAKKKKEKPAPVLAPVPQAAEPAAEPSPPHAPDVSSAPPQPQVPKEMVDLIASTIDDVGDDDGWAYLGEVGGLLTKKQPSFDSRNYGFKKLTLMVASIDCFEMDYRRNVQENNGKLIFIRNKRPA
jgi:hypothetical protein